jgi:hypothetical protein
MSKFHDLTEIENVMAFEEWLQKTACSADERNRCHLNPKQYIQIFIDRMIIIHHTPLAVLLKQIEDMKEHK